MSPVGEGVLEIGTPSKMIKSLRREEEGEEPEGCPGLKDEVGMVGTVTELG